MVWPCFKVFWSKKTISKSGEVWTLPAQLGQLKTGQDGKGLLRIHLWCPDDLLRLWDRIENRIDLKLFSNNIYHTENLRAPESRLKEEEEEERYYIFNYDDKRYLNSSLRTVLISWNTRSNISVILYYFIL